MVFFNAISLALCLLGQGARTTRKGPVSIVDPTHIGLAGNSNGEGEQGSGSVTGSAGSLEQRAQGSGCDATDYTIRVESRPNMCLHAKWYPDFSYKMQLHSCSAAPNEQFEYRFCDNTIRVKSKPELCLNAHNLDYKDVIQVLNCSASPNEQFEVRPSDNTIRPKSNTGMCFNYRLTTPPQLVQLYGCTAAANERFVWR